MDVDDSMDVIVFDIWGKFAHFRRPYTTSTLLSYDIPPRTTLSGMLASITGLWSGRYEYYQHMSPDRADIGLGIINAPTKCHMGVNHINSDKAKGVGMNRFESRGGHVPTHMELLRRPRYRVYFHHTDPEVHARTATTLREHQTAYTFVLGASGMLGNFEYVGEFEAHRCDSGHCSLQSVVRDAAVLTVGRPDEGERYVGIMLPRYMNEHRTTQEYDKILYESGGRPIRGSFNEVWEVDLDEGTKKARFMFM